MLQQKRIAVPGRAAIEGRSPKQTRKHTKIKQIKSKIFKNLNEIPIELPHSTKENIPNNHPQRPHSSLLPQDHKPRAIRVESALSQYPEHRQPRNANNRKRLSLDSTGKRYERDSLASRNSLTKKMSKNTKSIEEGLKIRIAEQRKKSNVSCISAIEEGRTHKKHSVKIKRPSATNLHFPVPPKDKQNKDPKKKLSKSRSKSKNKLKKIKIHLDKSKISTVAISIHEKGFAKKKTSTSTAHIVPVPKKKKKQQKKKSKSKSPRVQQNQDQFSQEQYPINKYDVSYSTKKISQGQLHHNRSKTKSRKASNSREQRLSSIEIDYMSCINIPSNSSGLINSHNSKESIHSKIKIVDNWQFKYLGEQHCNSIDFEEIRYYESQNWTQKKQEKEFMNRNFKDQEKYRVRRVIEKEIEEEYPHFEQIQLKFLASVIFIQRKWREKRLYRQVFKKIGDSNHKISQINFQQSNSKQLNISNNGEKHLSGKKLSFQIQKNNCKEEQEIFVSQDLTEERRQKRLKNNIYLEYQEIDDYEAEHLETKSPCEHTKMNDDEVEFIYDQSESDRNLSPRSSKYEYLQNEIFPSMSYLTVKIDQLKEELQYKIHQYSELERSGAIDGRQYLKLKVQSETEFEREIEKLKKSRKDLKKGYLKFIDTCKFIKQESGLRRVSSESGPMAFLYRKVFNLDSTVKSQSSESMKRLAKRVLIRKEFFQSQKIQSSILNPTGKTQSARQHHKQKETTSLSARLFKKTEFNHRQNQPQRLQLNRIREGFLTSPSPQSNLISNPPSPNPIETLSQTKQNEIFQQILSQLSHELFSELLKIDERRQYSIDIIQQGSQKETMKIRPSDIEYFEIIDDSSSVQPDKTSKDEDFEIVEESKFRQIYKIQGLAERFDTEINRKHRNSNTHQISPAVSEPVPFEPEEILNYGQLLFSFLKRKHFEAQLVGKLNKNQGFSPRQYLKFLRDYEIIDEEYEPIISNETFVEWEDQFYNGVKTSKQNESYIKRQAATIFHRCIFECLISLLEDHRPSGEKGDPFPWENVVFFKRQLLPANLDSIFRTCLEKLGNLIDLKCGILEEKHLILSEEDLQGLHEQNQDKIINMLERELEVSPHNWYQVQQHGLEIKLQIDNQLFQYIMLEALDELLQIL